MPTQSQLLEITVRADWRELTQQNRVQRLGAWRVVEIAVAGSTLVMVLSRLLLPRSPWLDLL